MQIEVAGQRGALWWEYHKNCRWDGRQFHKTLAWLSTKEGASTWGDDGVYVGEARCSLQDRFTKDRGRKLSLSRLLKSMNLPKEERRKVWEQYHNRKSSSNGGNY